MNKLYCVLLVLLTSCSIFQPDSDQDANDETTLAAYLAAYLVFLSNNGNSTTCTGTKILFVTANTYTGNLGGRSGADSNCSGDGNKPSISCTNTKAVITISATDQIADFVGNSILCSTDVLYGTNGNKIADNWSDLLDGSINDTISNAMTGGVSAPMGYHTSSNSDGTFFGGNNCSGSGYTSTSGNSGYGVSDSTSQHISIGGGSLGCGSPLRLLCLCY